MIELTDMHSAEINNHQTTVVDFYSPSCMPCKKMMTVLEDLEKTVEGDVEFYKINATENPKMVKRFGVMSLPTILVLQGGIVEEKFTGLTSKTAIMNAID